MTREELIAQAKKDDKLIRSQTLAGIFTWTPEQLEKANADGKFRWSAENFTLRDKGDRSKELNARRREIQEELDLISEELRGLQ